MIDETPASTDEPEIKRPQEPTEEVEQPRRRRVLQGAATLATAIMLGKEFGMGTADAGETAEPSAGIVATTSGASKVTVTLQQMDISVQPIGERFELTLSIEKDSANNVSIEIPELEQTFLSSEKSPNFSPKDFPTLLVTSPGSDTIESYSYPQLPDNYPLGGFIDTVDNAIPEGFRPTSGVPVKFLVESEVAPGVTYLGLIDHQGWLQFSALDDYPLHVGVFSTPPARISYAIGGLPRVDIRNFQITRGSSNSAKWNPNDFKDPRSIHFDFGDYDDAQKGFLNGTYYATWADNSATLPHNSENQAYKSYALAKFKVNDFGKTIEMEGIVNLSHEPGGETLDPDFSYAEGGAAIDPTDELILAATYQQRKSAGNGFVVSRSFDGGKTWTKKLIAVAKLDNLDEPLDPNIPLGKSDIHTGFDRFGGLWISYLHGKLTSTPAGFEGGPVELIYSSDKGDTFAHVLSQNALEQAEVPAALWPFYVGLDYTYLAIGPDATNVDYDAVWMSIGDAIDGSAPNEYQQRVWGLRVKGLGMSEIDLSSLRKYVVPSSHEAGYGSMDVGPKGEVVVALRQVNVKGSYIEQLTNNNRLWINVLERGLADDGFSEKREFGYIAIGDSTNFPATPHNNYLGTGTSMIAIDRSDQHPGRIYAVYCNRPGIYSFASKPYLTWSDDGGMSWSNPLNVSTDKSLATATRPNIAIDPRSGVVALSWIDARNSQSNTDMHRYATFLDPRDLA